jgi:16S rRNA (adenine1518-N6/adenine1519-N6)-dimethyltransferase
VTFDPTALLGAKRLMELLERHGARPTKSLGQNFVIDPNTIRKVIAASGVTADDHVLEIGAGPGSLTLGLAAAAAKVSAVEIDRRLLPVLEEATAGTSNVDVIQGDALEVDLASFGANKLVGNLPYNIATQIVLRTLETTPAITSLTVMTQKEAGDRLASSPGSKVYGATSVLCAFHGTARVVGTISRRAFFPVPNVDSVMVRIERRPAQDVDAARFYRVVKAAFAQRRKMARSTLAEVFGSPEAAVAALESAGAAAGARAEEIGLEAYLKLAASSPEI